MTIVHAGGDKTRIENLGSGLHGNVLEKGFYCQLRRVVGPVRNDQERL